MSETSPDAVIRFADRLDALRIIPRSLVIFYYLFFAKFSFYLADWFMNYDFTTIDNQAVALAVAGFPVGILGVMTGVQEVVTLQVETITKSVEENTRTVKATSSSVDGFVLVVLDIQISDLEDQIDSLERDKRNQAAAWNERDERNLRDRQKNLADLGVQRETLFARLINPTP